MKCEYCGEEEATEKIANPNLDMTKEIDWNNNKNWWPVCKDCKKVIPLQRMSSMDLGEKMNDKIEDELNKITERTGKPIMSACIFKNKDGSLGVISKETNPQKTKAEK